MRELYSYYERELAYMREMAGEFAKIYPDVAGRLDIQRHQCDDPHVERLIEAFCLISARIHHRLDSEFPEISQALLNLIYPAYLRPIPSLSIAQFQIDPKLTAQSESLLIPAGEPLTAGEFCEFRTCYPVELWPITVEKASVLESADFPAWAPKRTAAAGILLRISAPVSFEKLSSLRRLRFALRGTTHAPYTLYEFLFNYLDGMVIHDPGNTCSEPLRLKRDEVQAVGFEEHESLLPFDRNTFFGFRLLQEYFTLPEKFLFFDLSGLQVLSQAKMGKQAEILFLLDRKTPKDERFRRLQFSTSAESFALGCTPIVNLFRKIAEPIRVDQRKPEYAVQPDLYRPDEMEVFSIDSVRGRALTTKLLRNYKPLFSFQHSHALNDSQQAFWYGTRRSSRQRGDEGTDVFLSLVDLGIEPARIPDETLLVETTCTNRDLPTQVNLHFEFSDDSRFRDSRIQWRLIQRPSQPLRPPLDRKIDWRLISLLGVNYLGLSEAADADETPDGDPTNALKELLTLLDFSNTAAIKDRIGAIRAISTTPIRARVKMRRAGQLVPVYCHGLAVTIDFDEEVLAATGAFLFGAVLERFLGQYCSLNSFTQLTATSHKGTRTIREWPPRAGNQVLL